MFVVLYTIVHTFVDISSQNSKKNRHFTYKFWYGTAGWVSFFSLHYTVKKCNLSVITGKSSKFFKKNLRWQNDIYIVPLWNINKLFKEMGKMKKLWLYTLFQGNLQYSCIPEEDYVKLLDILNPSTLQSLSAFSRDETPRLLFHLLLSQPKLLLIGLRSILL